MSLKIQLPLAKWEELVRRYEAGETITTLCKEVPCADRVLRKYLVRYGAVIRPPGRAPKDQKEKWAKDKEASAKPDLREHKPAPVVEEKKKPKRKVVEW